MQLFLNYIELLCEKTGFRHVYLRLLLEFDEEDVSLVDVDGN